MFECKLCSKQYGNTTYILEHLALHSEDRLFPCQQCGISFKTRNYLKKHMTKHGEKNVTCHICGTQFHSRHQLKNHESVHFDHKQFRCSTCGRGFNHATTLKRHSYTHVGFKIRHQCHLCGATFNRKSNLHRHIVDVHADNRVAKRQRTQRKAVEELQQQQLEKEQNLAKKQQHIEVHQQQLQTQQRHIGIQQQQQQHLLHNKQQQSELQFGIHHVGRELPTDLSSAEGSNVYIAPQMPWTIVHEVTDIDHGPVAPANPPPPAHIQLVAVPLPRDDMPTIESHSVQ